MKNNRSALFRGRHFAGAIIALCVRWYLRFSLSYRDLEELTTERGLSVDHRTVWRWVQRYSPELDRRVRQELKRAGTSWRVDETCVRAAGRWMYLYRALDSWGATLDFYLSEKRDPAAAKQFLGKVLAAANHPRPRVINVDGNPSYPHAVSRLKREGRLGQRCRCRPSRYLNNIVEQDHRGVKRRINAKQGFRSFEGARRTISGYEVMPHGRKRQVRWLLKEIWAGRFCSST